MNQYHDCPWCINYDICLLPKTHEYLRNFADDLIVEVIQ